MAQVFHDICQSLQTTSALIIICAFIIGIFIAVRDKTNVPDEPDEDEEDESDIDDERLVKLHQLTNGLIEDHNKRTDGCLRTASEMEFKYLACIVRDMLEELGYDSGASEGGCDCSKCPKNEQKS